MNKKLPFIVFISSFAIILSLYYASSAFLGYLDRILCESYSREASIALDPKQIFAQKILDKITRSNSIVKGRYFLNFTKKHILSELHLGGQIWLSEDLLNGLKTEQGLAFMIAHEIAHGELGHNKDLLRAIFRDLQDDDGNLYAGDLSKADELAADKLAIKLLDKTYESLSFKDISEIFKFLNLEEDKLLKEMNIPHTREELFLKYNAKLQHPDDSTRKIAIRQYLDELGVD